MLLGIFGGMGFAVLASVGGLAVGGTWAATPILAWSALFGVLGWNFLDYGVLSPPGGSIDWGWAVCGVLFWGMAGFPLLGLLPLAGGGGRGEAGGGRTGRGQGAVRLAGPGQPPSAPTVRSVTTSTVRRSVDVVRRRRPAAEQVALDDIAAGFGAAITAAMAGTPVDPTARAGTAAPGRAAEPAPTPTPAPTPAFTEGTQALLDRLERLADMRDRGLLTTDDYETAKDAIVAELEGRS
jgi:hypothetical protein